MPSFNIILKEIDVSETARYAGLRSQRDFPLPLIKQACLDAKLYCQPKAVWEIYDYDRLNGIIHGPDQLRLKGESIVAFLAECEKIAILAVTIGDQLENRAAELFDAGSYAAGLLLDAAGTAAVEIAADKLEHYINTLAAQEGMSATTRFSPGYGDWDITIQPRIAQLADAATAGISVNASCMLFPRKSITAVIGFATQGADLERQYCRDNNCSRCLKPNCYARRRL